jgi:hypothetical protein
MLNPYSIRTPEILSAMLKQPMYFVRQEYRRGKEILEQKNIPILLTHYHHHEGDRERAERHIRLLYKDPCRFLYDSTNPLHQEKLFKAASQPKGYRIFINLLPKEWKANNNLKMKINRYVKERLPCWNYSPADKLKVTLKERYGELFIALLWRGRQTEVLLDDIENFSLCATT